jgi:hypothetical protein
MQFQLAQQQEPQHTLLHSCWTCLTSPPLASAAAATASALELNQALQLAQQQVLLIKHCSSSSSSSRWILLIQPGLGWVAHHLAVFGTLRMAPT